MRYERTDGVPIPVRVTVSNEPFATKILVDALVEDSPDVSSEFTYQDFLIMIHKRI